MTIQEFAQATGFSTSYIGYACRRGKIPCDTWNGAYEIPSRLVKVWIKKRLSENDTKNLKNSVSLYQKALDKYNNDNGTYYSYGQAVHLGLLSEN